MNWVYGLTTVPERFLGHLGKTLHSLATGGFDRPHLFVDGANNAAPYAKLGLDLTMRYPRVRTAANWYLALQELYCRNPRADRYAVFQDDVEMVPGVREYLEACTYPERGYLNMYTVPLNEKLAKGDGWFMSNQHGKGALALVFNREVAKLVLTSKKLVDRFESEKFGHQAIDGGVVEAMKAERVYEWCHYPSLVQHTGCESTMGTPQRPVSSSYCGKLVSR